MQKEFVERRILEYKKSMEEDNAIADIKVEPKGDNKMEKAEKEVDQKIKRWTRNEKCHFATYRQQWEHHFPRDCQHSENQQKCYLQASQKDAGRSYHPQRRLAEIRQMGYHIIILKHSL